MATNLIKSSNEITPQKGHIIYNEYRNDEDKMVFADLLFIDTQPEESGQWYITSVSHMEDYGDGLQVDLISSAGEIPKEFTRMATDEDLKKFLEIASKNSDVDLNNWIDEIYNSENYKDVLANEEKDRLKKVVSEI